MSDLSRGLRLPFAALCLAAFAVTITACGEPPSFTSAGQGAYRVPGSSDAVRQPMPPNDPESTPPESMTPESTTPVSTGTTATVEATAVTTEMQTPIDAGPDAQTEGTDGGAASSSGSDVAVVVTNGSGSASASGSGPGREELVLIEQAKRAPKFGLLVNDLECGLCHVSVIGDVASTRRVPPLWPTSDVHLEGRWLAAAAFDAATPEGGLGSNVSVTTTGGVALNYRGAELPLGADGHPAFPVLDFDALAAKMLGSVHAAGAYPAAVTKVYDGNLVLVGTDAAPILIDGDVLVTGDLVIKGTYSGTGSLYVKGNIYVPGDLRAARSAFPFDNDGTTALVQATAQMAAKNTDALGLAAQGSIFIGDIQKHQNSDPGNEAVNVYNHPATPENRRGEALGVLEVLNWFPGGAAGFDQLYDMAFGCLTQARTQIGSFNMVEAFLYAKNTVAGISRRASYTIRGGVIADYFHIVQGAARCGANLSPVHGRPSNRSYIEYDYRLKTGLLRILEHVGALFPQAVP